MDYLAGNVQLVIAIFDFYCLKLFSHKIDKVIDISLLDNEEDVLSISIGVNA